MEINSLLESIKEEHALYEFKIKSLKTDIARLTQQGTCSGKFYIRKDKSKKTGEIIETFYIIYPQKNGKRRKEYVGRDKQNAKEAFRKMERYKDREILKEALFRYERERDQICNSLEKIISAFDTCIRLAG